MRMGWHDLLFAHWPVDAQSLRAIIPEPLELDLYDGQAWIGVVPFRMSDVAPRCIPALPGISAFPELNVRTYVTYDGKPGVWFFSLDAANRLAVRAARLAFALPYMDAEMSLRIDNGTYQYSSHRTHRGEPPARFIASYQPQGPVWHAQPATLEHWLTARYCLYSSRWRKQGDAASPIYRGEIDHDPWPLQNATCRISENTLCDPIGLPLPGDPHLLFVKDIHVHAWWIHKI
ncbi:hypothetical protein Pla52n_61820 [Stieleria varia]|uniref:DUF2071 domain-containing protein n=2 Tax=Stieleria varia TaxID=2528005 RepID=A0A5C6A0H9_9BACT|nr:hypothetical protein Pla52n_61820 [Stieleria varia]